MPKPTMLYEWVTKHFQTIVVVLAMVANLYLVSNFTTKEEFQAHLKTEVEMVEKRNSADEKIHVGMNENLATLSKAVNKLEFIASVTSQMQHQTQENTIKLAGIDERLKNVEKRLESIKK
jgi:hypothetical protein